MRPSCPKCGAKPIAAFLKPAFACPRCGTRLISNLRWVSFLEWIIGGVPFFLIAWFIHLFTRWSYVEIVSLLFLPVCIVHVVVIAKFVLLEADENPTRGKPPIK